MCVNPRTIRVEQSHPNAPPFRMVQVPCGKCFICINKYQNSWVIRCLEEFKNWNYSTLLTLTYNEQKVPYLVQPSTGEVHNTVYKKHVQDWLKRFRTRYKRRFERDAQFKYFICAEYGPETIRPHYHAIIFGLSKIELSLAICDWRETFGFVRASDINLSTIKSRLNSARYLGNYLMKGDFETPLVEQSKVLPVFRLVSKGLGLSYVAKHKEHILHTPLSDSRYEDIIDKLKYNVNNFVYALPRYYKDKILPPKSYLRFKTQNAALARSDALYRAELAKLLPEVSEAQAVSIMALQTADALRQRNAELAKSKNKILKKSKI